MPLKLHSLSKRNLTLSSASQTNESAITGKSDVMYEVTGVFDGLDEFICLKINKTNTRT